ncbi:MAG: hypothetical protein ABI459_06735 [Deltaproteobacteria bacterium]
MVRKLIKFLFFLVVLAFAIVAGYAYFGDMSPVQTEVQQDLILGGPPAEAGQ